MYYNISFQTWLNKARKRMELEALNDNIAGSEESNEDFSDILNDPEEVSQISEGSFITFRQEEVASSSSNFGSESGIEDDSQSSEFATITENEELEDGEKEHPDASFEEGFKGKRLFNDKEEEEIERKMNIPTHIMETDERKEEDVLSEGERQLEDKTKRSIFEKLDSKSGETSQFDKRKSSAPDPEPYNLPKIEKNSDNLKIIEENHLEQTFSVENKSNDDQV
uniref:Uncharacterized protein n=1 Tax=Euplotes crassus TaxID=5936 RepID=A0A7S3KUA3_EUPCR